MAPKLKNLSVTKVALVDAGANQEADVLIYKSAEEPHPEGGHTVADDTVAKSDHDAVVAELDAAKAELAALAEMSNDDLAALRGFEIAKSAPAEDEVLKGIPEAVRKRLEEAEERVAKMEAAQRGQSFIAKAAEYGHIGGAAELGPVLEEIDRKAPEAGKVLDTYLKAAEARLATGEVFKELGTSGDASDNAAEAAIAAEVAKGATRPEAIRKVFTEHPELYAAAQNA